MSQATIAKILKKNYPKYLLPLDIARESKLSLRTVENNLSRLRKRNEIEYKVIEGKCRFKTLYRLKGGTNDK